MGVRAPRAHHDGSALYASSLSPQIGETLELRLRTDADAQPVADPDASFRGTDFARYLTPIMGPKDDIVSKLAEIGLAPKDIDILVSTHFHFDHAGCHGDFGDSRIVTQRAIM